MTTYHKVMLVACLLTWPAFAVYASECELPAKIRLHIANNANPYGRGAEVEITEVAAQGETVRAKITLYGSARDRCELRATPMTGTCSAGVLKLTAVVLPGDTITCPTSYELINKEGHWSGTYTGSTGAGVATAR